MKKIVIDARESGTSTGRYIDKLVEHLHRLEPPYRITLLAKPHRIEHLKAIAPSFEVLHSGYKEFTFAEQLGLWRQVKKLNADLVHFGMTQQPILYKGRAITTVHDLTTARFNNSSKNYFIFKFKQLVYRRVIKFIAKKSKALITPTHFVRNDLAGFAHVNKSKIVVTYEAADKIKDPPEPIEVLENAEFIMYVGRPQPHKNLGRLVEAFSELKKSRPNLKLVFVGKKDILYERLEQKVKRHNITDVVFTGFVSEGSLRWLYENTAAYVFPSLSEGFGLPGLEAMAHGAPVASSNTACLPEVYADAAHYFNPTDAPDMATKIGDILANPKLREQLIKNGAEQVKKYSWEKMAKQTLAVYKKVLGD